MTKCKVKGCKNFAPYNNTSNPYCHMHMARIRRHGYPELKRNAYRSLEKMPHKFVDSFINKNCHKMFDEDIAKKLIDKGIVGVTVWNVRYRRRKLGVKKYLHGEIQKHKAWVRAQAIKEYGNRCELCGYSMTVDAHHIIPKHEGGPHEINNLMIICPNCHALITRRIFMLKNRVEIAKVRKNILKLIKSFYPSLK